MKRLITIIAAAVLCAGLAGCPSQSTTSVLVTALGNAAASVAAIENNPTLAAKIQADTAAASAQVLAWKAGTPSQNAVQALELVETDLSLVCPTTASGGWQVDCGKVRSAHHAGHRNRPEHH